MSHTFRKDCSLYEHHPMSKFDTSAHASTSSGTSTSSGQSFGFSFSRQQSKMDSNQVSFGSEGSFNSHISCSGPDGLSGNTSGFGGNFGQRASSHQNSEGSFTPRNHSGNYYSPGSRSFGNSGHKLESGSNNGGSAGQSSSFSSGLPHLGSGGNLTVVGTGKGGHKKGGPPLDWDRLVDGVFTDEIAKLF